MEPRPFRCETCRFWDPEDGNVRGRCRVNPPDPDGRWPYTGRDDWCGKYLVNTSLPPIEE